MKKRGARPGNLPGEDGAATGNSDTYLTIAREATAEIKIERSLFIGHTWEIATEAAAKEFIARIQEKHRQATHNCFAYRLGKGKGEITYYSDAGEPGGTAGRPILGAITSQGLTNVAVVVTRYFGGKKLGVRGLIEAYSQAARQVLEKAGVVRRVRTRELEVTCSYVDLDRVLYVINAHGGRVLAAEYGAEVRLKAALPFSAWEELQGNLISLVSENPYRS